MSEIQNKSLLQLPEASTPFDGSEWLYGVQDEGDVRFSPAQLAGAGVQTATVALTSTQLLHLHSAPPVIIPAPAANQFIQVLSSSYALAYGTIAYQKGVSDTSGLWYGNPPPNTSPNADGGDFGVWVQAANAINSGVVTDGGAGPGEPISYYAGQPVVLWIPDADMTAGDGTGSITVSYLVVTLPFAA